jgi:hypothetical protein
MGLALPARLSLGTTPAMFDELRFRYKIWRLHKSRRASLKRYGVTIENARRRNAGESEILRIAQDEKLDDTLDRDQIAKLQMRHLLDQADKLLIPRPEVKIGETWIESPVSGYHLNPDTTRDLRDAIRKERKERSEVFRLWLGTIGGIIGALTGIIGATIGLLAYIDKFHTSPQPPSALAAPSAAPAQSKSSP